MGCVQTRWCRVGMVWCGNIKRAGKTVVEVVDYQAGIKSNGSHVVKHRLTPEVSVN